VAKKKTTNRVEAICKAKDKVKYRWFQMLEPSVQDELKQIRLMFQRGETDCKTHNGLATAILENIPEVEIHLKTLTDWLKK